jgi:hypothetical protein
VDVFDAHGKRVTGLRHDSVSAERAGRRLVLRNYSYAKNILRVVYLGRDMLATPARFNLASIDWKGPARLVCFELGDAAVSSQQPAASSRSQTAAAASPAASSSQ